MNETEVTFSDALAWAKRIFAENAVKALNARDLARSQASKAGSKSRSPYVKDPERWKRAEKWSNERADAFQAEYDKVSAALRALEKGP